jgi:Streptomyces sporulation and cell division protein, SsgA
MDQLWPGGDPRPVRAHLRWRSTDPYTVQLGFHTRVAPDVVWVLSRELLAQGLTGEAGMGDVRLQPAPDATVLLQLRPPTGQTWLRIENWVLEEFLESTYRHIPLGSETLGTSLDDEIGALLGVPGGHGNGQLSRGGSTSP